ncbi:MAG: hypothetical protein ACO1SX_11170, partial [Actinomycetota bacterium]
MSTAATLAAFEADLDQTDGAVDALRGDLPLYPDLAGRDAAELLEECRNINSGMLQLRIERTMRVLELLRRAGDAVTSRTAEVGRIGFEINTSKKTLLRDIQVLRYLTPEKILNDYQTLSITHLHDAARLTARAGEAPDAPERVARVHAALDTASDQH